MPKRGLLNKRCEILCNLTKKCGGMWVKITKNLVFVLDFWLLEFTQSVVEWVKKKKQDNLKFTTIPNINKIAKNKYNRAI